MYLYESHMGGFYTTINEQSYEDLYCDECGDSDWPLGEVESAQEMYDIICEYEQCSNKFEKESPEVAIEWFTYMRDLAKQDALDSFPGEEINE